MKFKYLLCLLSINEASIYIFIDFSIMKLFNLKRFLVILSKFYCKIQYLILLELNKNGINKRQMSQVIIQELFHTIYFYENVLLIVLNYLNGIVTFSN